MKSSMRLMTLLFVTMFLPHAESAIAASELVTYKNADYGFSFSYPSNWKREIPRSSIGVVKISSQNGYGAESCNLAVHKSPSLRGKATSQVVKSLSPSILIAELRRGGVTDATALDSGLTKVFNRDAYYVILSYTIETMGERIPVKSLQVITTKSDTVYTFTCGTADVTSFSVARVIFRTIIGSLFIDP